MQPTRLRQAEMLFDEIVDLPHSMREDALTSRCPNDTDMRSFVRQLIASHESGNVALRTPVYELLAESGELPQSRLPQRIGRYRVLDIIGEGGMGIVYLAEQDQPKRRLALKVVRPAVATPTVVRRFTHEADILAQLDHPGIATIFDAGVAEVQSAGRPTIKWPYLAMGYVRGAPLLDYVNHHHLDTDARVDMLAHICDAVQHAHQQGVVHRDLKPGNILVDERGQPKVLDFGIARLTHSDICAVTTQTEAGQLVGTMPYMSPEQVCGVSSNIDTRSDIYALGVIGFELLCGRLPHLVADHSIPDAVRMITEDLAPRLGSIDTVFRGDLETIVMKALEKDKRRRYQSASELAADLRSYLHHRPIAARPPTTLYQLRMFARRNKTLVGGVITTFLALVIGLAGITTLATRVTRERNHAREAEILADQRRILAERHAYNANIAAAHAALRANNIPAARYRLNAASPSLRNWEWHFLFKRLDDSRAVLRAHEHHVWSTAFTDDGRTLFSASADKTVIQWDLTTGKRKRAFSAGEGALSKVALSPDGRRIAAASADSHVYVWDLDTGDLVMDLGGHTKCALDVAFSPDGRLMASVGYDGQALIWNAKTGELVDSFDHPDLLHHVAFSPDGTVLATACRDNIVRTWNMATGACALEIQAMPPSPEWIFVHSWGLTFSPDGRQLATGAHDGTAKLWDSSTGQLLVEFHGHTERVRTVSFAPGGRQLATASDDNTVRIWDVASGSEIALLLGHESGVFGLIHSSDGKLLASASGDGTVRIWDTLVASDPLQFHVHGNRGIPGLAISQDEKFMISAGEDRRVVLWDLESLTVIGESDRHDAGVFAAAISDDGRLAATGSRDGVIHIWQLSPFAHAGTMATHTKTVRELLFLEDGEILASASNDGTIRLWETKSLTQSMMMSSDTEEFYSLAVTPDQARLVSGSKSGVMETWSVADGTLISRVDAHDDSIRQVLFSPDARVMVSTSADSTIKIWAGSTGQLLHTLTAHNDEVSAAAFSPDGTRLASVSFDRALRLWDAESWETVLSFRVDSDWPRTVTFSRDGRRIFSSGAAIRVWEAAGALTVPSS
ncbi:MAG: protein kinase domain-containing protein [Planctomycetota bacterium]|jgi:WD40 repeat protein